MTMESDGSGTGKRDVLMHELPRKVARKYGCESAAVLRGLARKVQASKNEKNGRKWFYDPIETLAAQKWPYIPPSTLHDILKRLKEKGLVITGRFNQASFDRTVWYSMPQAAMNAAAEDILFFDVEIAKKFDIESALIFHNLKYHLGRAREKEPAVVPYHRLSPTNLARGLPMSEKTIKRRIKKLKEAGLIVRNGTRKGMWTIPDEVKNEGTISDEQGSKPDEKGSDSDEIGSDSDNNTLYETCKKPFGNPLKGQQPEAAVQFTNLLSSDTSRPDKSDDRISANAEDEDKLRISVFESLEDIHGLIEVVQDDRFLEKTKNAVTELVDDCLQAMTVADYVRASTMSFCEVSEWLQRWYSERWKTTRCPVRSDDPTTIDFLEICTWQCLFLAISNRNVREKRTTKVLTHPDKLLSSLSYNVELHIGRALEDHQKRKHADWVERRKRKYASKDVDKEDIPDLPPADKRRVFENALWSRDAIGGSYWDGTYWKARFIRVTHSSSASIERIFRENPSCTPADLLSVMDGCIKRFMTEQAPLRDEHDPLWHVRRGTDVEFFTSHLHAICRELQIDCPIEVPESRNPPARTG